MAGCGRAPAPTGVVRPGIEVLLTDSSHLVAGRRVGLITNHTGVARDGTRSIEWLQSHGVDLVALFAPEHGILGDVAEGRPIASGVDERSGLSVYSLYGETNRPTPEMLAGFDGLVFDMQEIGARYYTRIAIMALAMQAAAESGLPFIVLDRPNPLGGQLVQGNVLDPRFASLVGLYPIPMRHGMTIGELARLFNDAFGIGVNLSVVPIDGWRRDVWFDETELPWVPTSPNMPTLASATHYPGTCLFEGTNLSVGRGTDAAFQQIGAPWLNGAALAQRLNRYRLPGTRFEAVTFTPVRPSDGKYGGELLSGVHFVATDRALYDPTLAAAAALVEAKRMAGDRWEWNVRHFDRLAGTSRLRELVDAGADLRQIAESWANEVAAFMPLRAGYLLY
jgi:uncharacterized protein YbbC (DUF1343 family)